MIVICNFLFICVLIFCKHCPTLWPWYQHAMMPVLARPMILFSSPTPSIVSTTWYNLHKTNLTLVAENQASCLWKCNTEDVLWKLISSVNIENNKINFIIEAEHVGILRFVKRNLPGLLSWFSAQRKLLMADLSVGLARGHCGNPAVIIRIKKIDGTRILLIGLSSLVLSKTEINCCDQHYKKFLESLQNFTIIPPVCVFCFLPKYHPAVLVGARRRGA